MSWPRSGPDRGEPAGGAGFVVSLERFSGPLDLLLHLIRREEIDIADIPIAPIAEQFLAAIHALGLDEAAEYLELAARLLRIKAQMLLPRRAEDEAWEDPRHELVRRLLEYQQIREVAEWLGRSERERADAWARGFLPPAPERLPAPLLLGLEDLLVAVERVAQGLEEPVLYRVMPRPLDLDGAKSRVLALLAARGRFGWGELLGRRPRREMVLAALIVVLELARLRSLHLTQRRPFGPVVMDRGSAYQAA